MLQFLIEFDQKMEPPAKKANISVSNQIKDNLIETQKQITQNVLTYDVLRIIFKYLGAKDLFKVASMCRSWRDAANNEIASRKAPEFLLTNIETIDLECSDNASSLGNKLRIVPSFGLVSVKINEEGEFSENGCYCENLPTNCSAVILGGYEIVTEDVRIETKIGMSISTFLPKIPNLNHKIFHVENRTLKGASNTDNVYARKLVKRLLPTKTEKSKCIIMLTNRKGYHFTKVLMKELQKSYSPGTLSLWGGVCVNLHLCEASKLSRLCSKKVRWTAITLSSPSLQCWSIVLLSSNSTEYEEKLENFKNNIKLKKHTLALLFSCCERTNLKDMEVAVFKKVFPNIPLAGLYGEGEYGINTLNKSK